MESFSKTSAGRKNREKLPPLLSQDIVHDAAFLAIKTINNFVLFSQSKVYWNAKDGFQKSQTFRNSFLGNFRLFEYRRRQQSGGEGGL